MATSDDRLWVGSMPETYDRLLGPVLFEPYARDLARRVAASSPDRVLELAAGTGIVTKELTATLPGAAVVATDLNDAMVALGAANAPGAAWREADALELPFDDDAFDVVACQFGVMFFPDKPKAFAEAGRVMGRDGRLLFNVWGAVEDNGLAEAFVEALEQQFPDDPPTMLRRIPHGYHDRARLEADLAAGGLRVEAFDRVTLTTEAVPAQIAAGFCFGTPIRAEIAARTDDLDAVAQQIAAAMTERLGDGPVATTLDAVIVEARRR